MKEIRDDGKETAFYGSIVSCAFPPIFLHLSIFIV